MLTFSLNKKNFQDEANTKNDDEAKKHKIKIKIKNLFTIYKYMYKDMEKKMHNPTFSDVLAFF
jgi:hypothetical protein